MDEYYYPEAHLCPEEIMWRTVLILFMEDVQKDYFLWREALNGQRPMYKCNLDAHYSDLQDEWTRTMCDYASVDYANFKTIIHSICTGAKEIKLNKNFVY